MREEVIANILEAKIIAIVRGVGAEECMKVAPLTRRILHPSRRRQGPSGPSARPMRER